MKLRSVWLAAALAAASVVATGCSVSAEGEEMEVGASEAAATSSLSGKFEVKNNRVTLKAKNGETVLVSQQFSSAQAAAKNMDAILEYGAYGENYKIKKAQDGSYYFVLQAYAGADFGGNNEILATSEMYTSRANAKRGATAVRSVLLGDVAVPATSGKRFELFQGQDGDAYFRLRAQNGETILKGSEGYENKASARKTANLLRTEAITGGDATANFRWEVLQAASGEWFFHAENYAAVPEIVAVSSETYTTKSAATTGMKTAQKILGEVDALQ